MSGAIIVVEGTDGVGKTTLVDHIIGAWSGSARRMRHGPPGEIMPALAYFDAVTNMIDLANRGHLVISDRLHVGELVYGPLLRGGSDLSVNEAFALDMLLDGAGAMMVHCTVSMKELRRRLVQRDGGEPDDKSGATLEHSLPLKALFHSLIDQDRGQLPGRWQNQDMNTYPDQMASTIVTQAKIRRQTSHHNWIGRPDAEIVLALPYNECLNVEHLSWIVGNLREMGTLRNTAIVYPGATPPGRSCALVALGNKAGEWLDLEGWEWHGHTVKKHRVDEQYYDDSPEVWKRAVVRCSREALTETVRT